MTLSEDLSKCIEILANKLVFITQIGKEEKKKGLDM